MDGEAPKGEDAARAAASVAPKGHTHVGEVVTGAVVLAVGIWVFGHGVSVSQYLASDAELRAWLFGGVLFFCAGLVWIFWHVKPKALRLVPLAALIGGIMYSRHIMAPPDPPVLALSSATGAGRPITEADTGSVDRLLTITNPNSSAIHDVCIYLQMPELILSSWINKQPQSSDVTIGSPPTTATIGKDFAPAAVGSGVVEAKCDPYKTFIAIKIANLSPGMSVEAAIRTRGQSPPEVVTSVAERPSYFVEGSFRYDTRGNRPARAFVASLTYVASEGSLDLGKVMAIERIAMTEPESDRCYLRVSTGTTPYSGAGLGINLDQLQKAASQRSASDPQVRSRVPKRPR
jgi:hypothetical protein